MDRSRQVVIVALATAVAFVLLVEPAVAATSQVGKNVGNEVANWGKALLLGTATLMGIPAVAKRDVSEGMKIALLVLVLGGFIFATDVVEGLIKAIWKSVK